MAKETKLEKLIADCKSRKEDMQLTLNRYALCPIPTAENNSCLYARDLVSIGGKLYYKCKRDSI